MIFIELRKKAPENEIDYTENSPLEKFQSRTLTGQLRVAISKIKSSDVRINLKKGETRWRRGKNCVRDRDEAEGLSSGWSAGMIQPHYTCGLNN